MTTQMTVIVILRLFESDEILAGSLVAVEQSEEKCR